MAKISINSISVKNYRSFGKKQEFHFLDPKHKKPIAIVGYNNTGKTNLINAIKYGLYESVREDTFTLNDFHQCDWDNPPCFALSFTADINDNKIFASEDYYNISMIKSDKTKILEANDYCTCYENTNSYSKKWTIKQSGLIYYINFHNIKEEISTQKTSWGNLRSFLGKHIDAIVKNDVSMSKK